MDEANIPSTYAVGLFQRGASEFNATSLLVSILGLTMN